MTAGTDDVKLEYEKLVPPSEHKSIFEESEDYDSLRQYIIDQPQVKLHDKKLPFSEVRLIPYLDYKREETIDKEQSTGKHLFYLKQSSKGEHDFCDAAGYYIKQTGQFVLLSFSSVVIKPSGRSPRTESENLKISNGVLYVLSPITFRSPEAAALYVLRKRVSADVWQDSQGVGLLAYYRGPAENVTPSSSLKSSFKNQNLNAKAAPQIFREFYIKEENVCDASGYYDMEKDCFILKKGSKLSVSASPYFTISQMGKTREHILTSSCLLLGGYYVLQTDITCSSATIAASYVKGVVSTYVEWEDKHKKVLADYYPERFYKKG